MKGTEREGERAPESMTVMNYRRVCVYVYVCEHTAPINATVAQPFNLVNDECFTFLSEIRGLYKPDTQNKINTANQIHKSFI